MGRPQERLVDAGFRFSQWGLGESDGRLGGTAYARFTSNNKMDWWELAVILITQRRVRDHLQRRPEPVPRGIPYCWPVSRRHEEPRRRAHPRGGAAGTGERQQGRREI